MIIKVENQSFNIETNFKLLNNTFDIVNNKFISTMQYEKTFKTNVYNYTDYNLLICPVYINNKKHIRIILYNIDTQKQYVLFQSYTKEDIRVYRKSKDCFIVLCIINNISTMHFLNITEDNIVHSSLCLYNLHQVSFVHNNIIANFSVDIVGTMHNMVVIYNKNGSMHQKIVDLPTKNCNILKYTISKNKIDIINKSTQQKVCTYNIT